MGAKIDKVPGRGPKVFKILEQIYHNTSAVRINDDSTIPKYSQLYFMDSAQATEQRSNLPSNEKCDHNPMEKLNQMLCECNPYAEVYKMMCHVAEEEDRLAEEENCPRMQVGMVLHNYKRTQDERRYNSPTANEIAVVFKSVDGKRPFERDIVGHLHIPERGNYFERISTK